MLIKKKPRGHVPGRSNWYIEKRRDNVDILDIKEGFYLKRKNNYRYICGKKERLDGYRISKSRKIKDIEKILQILKLKIKKI